MIRILTMLVAASLYCGCEDDDPNSGPDAGADGDSDSDVDIDGGADSDTGSDGIEKQCEIACESWSNCPPGSEECARDFDSCFDNCTGEPWNDWMLECVSILENCCQKRSCEN